MRLGESGSGGGEPGNAPAQIHSIGEYNDGTFGTIWARAREEIRPQMTGLSFHAWIDSLVPLTFRNGVLVLEAPNPDI